MLTSELVRAAIFVAVVMAVYVFSGWFLLHRLICKIRRQPSPALSKKQVWLHRIVYGMALLGIVCITYGYCIEPYWPVVERVTIATRKRASGTRSVRIVHISDLHCDPSPRLEERLPEIIAVEKPDLIVFTGDSINSARGLPVLQKCMKRLAAIAPTYVVRGNWDMMTFSRSLDIFGGTGVRELTNEVAPATVGGVPIWIAGIPARGEKPVDDVMQGIPEGSFVLLLHHYPDLIYEAARRRVDLYCAGHTHGGQVALPLYGALVTLSKFGKRFESGLYRIEETWMYVNRGIGMEGGPAPRVRFCSRPEITVIEIVPQS